MSIETKDNRAKEQARAQLDSIVEMVKRLEHCQDCDGEDCQLSDKEILEGIGIYFEEGMTATEGDRETYHNEDEARQAIEEDPLSVQVRSGWASCPEEMEAEEFEILLCTGGPACRITGGLDRNEPDSAQIEYQDWFTPWEEYLDTTHEERQALLTYARQFYFGS
ncbi:hypothetical protein ES707_15665 [subsurface metagenome]